MQRLDHRLAKQSDFNAVYLLYMNERANPFLTFDPMPEAEFKKIFIDMLSSQDLFVTELENEIVATYRLLRKTNRQSHILYLGGFTVKQSAQGKGYGKEILAFIKNYSVERSIKRIELTVGTENTNAIALYGNVGFEIEGKLKNNYRLASTGNYYDEFLMALHLD